METTKVLAKEIGVAGSCRALDISRASYYRYLIPKAGQAQSKNRPKSLKALNVKERQRVIEVMHSKRFMDLAPYQIYATLLDEGTYLCSVRTMYRILSEEGESKERRNQLRHPVYSKPELLATGPNQVWSWDITKLKGPAKWVYYYLYVILDIFSRYVVGWMVAHRESATLAKRLIEESCTKQGVIPGQLTIHADRGSSMKSKLVAQLLVDLGVTKTHNRPHVSNDNPFSESQFKTMKYRPKFPSRFGCIEDSRSFCRDFFKWYNIEHRHSGIGFMAPQMVHYGMADLVWEKRKMVLLEAALRHPERFPKKLPSPPNLPNAVWINKPKQEMK
jgi:putative transposase